MTVIEKPKNKPHSDPKCECGGCFIYKLASELGLPAPSNVWSFVSLPSGTLTPGGYVVTNCQWSRRSISTKDDE